MTYTIDEKTQENSHYFSNKHLYLSYLPPRVLPLTFVTLAAVFFLNNHSTLIIFVPIIWVLVVATQVSKYMKCWRKHEAFKKRYRMKYMDYFHHRVETDGFNVLISSYFSDVKPPFEFES